jgi:phosphoribosylformimino-5-aminoimidazole carboxamide ribonucleotide (ProFAR) isomerase
VAEATSAHLTASGGVSSVADLERLATVHPRVDEVIVGKALYAGRFTVADALVSIGGPA